VALLTESQLLPLWFLSPPLGIWLLSLMLRTVSCIPKACSQEGYGSRILAEIGCGGWIL